MVHYRNSKKKVRYIGILIVLIALTSVQCVHEYDDYPYYDTQFTYESSSDYTDNGDPTDLNLSIGEISSTFSSSYDRRFYIQPEKAFPFDIQAINLVLINDTTTFSIHRQSVFANSVEFNVTGTGNIQCGSFGKHDGFYTEDYIVFEYSSTDKNGYNKVITKTIAHKK